MNQNKIESPHVAKQRGQPFPVAVSVWTAKCVSRLRPSTIVNTVKQANPSAQFFVMQKGARRQMWSLLTMYEGMDCQADSDK